jgi:hypothetical protein
VNAEGDKDELGDEATGWIGQLEWFNEVGNQTFTAYVICAPPPVPE